jgi:hypothetical protein
VGRCEDLGDDDIPRLRTPVSPGSGNDLSQDEWEQGAVSDHYNGVKRVTEVG